MLSLLLFTKVLCQFLNSAFGRWSKFQTGIFMVMYNILLMKRVISFPYQQLETNSQRVYDCKVGACLSFPLGLSNHCIGTFTKVGRRGKHLLLMHVSMSDNLVYGVLPIFITFHFRDFLRSLYQELYQKFLLLRPMHLH